MKTFIDDNELPREESKTCIIVFSENYASSIWCLDELIKILQSMRSTKKFPLILYFRVIHLDLKRSIQTPR
ncbi:hypothetical protein DVH24_042256 [Malus domestica]|uniref:TIR domain-containing protein n=1 Tax=Malus domestica TaxID=3750 RepID=A0A498J0M4_MALDO|nr:hypothetical protein DVH24_042256 [Malus domestica]